jgi:cytochrome c peroxidase
MVGALAAASLIGVFGCGEKDATAPDTGAVLEPSKSERNALAAEVRQLTAGRGITALGRPPRVRPALVELGRALAFDKILSGNRDISCMTCHLPSFATGDARSLSIGQGASGLGTARVHPQNLFIPRNAPAAFNLFALEPLFWDGRVFHDEFGGLHTPADAAQTPSMRAVFEFGTLSALPLFPVLSREEMRANAGNELAAVDDDHPEQVWQALMVRLGGIPEYRRMFEQAYPRQSFGQMTFAHASNAIAGFLTSELAFNDSPWDRFLAGNDKAMTTVQLQGAKNFMSARCSICHNGPALTDNKFHNVAVAQIGPGKGGISGPDDFGRELVTRNSLERYAFRTPPLRNVELTAPYGHDGAIVDLRDFVDHYSKSDEKLRAYNPLQLESLLQGTLVNNVEAILGKRDILLSGVEFSAQTVDQVTEFMKALTDPAARNLDHVVPMRVPSGLPIDGARLGSRDAN